MAITETQLYELFQCCFGFAKVMLEKRGEFYPFGAQITADGLGMVAGHISEKPNPRELYEFLLGSLRTAAKDGKVLAVGLAADVTIPKQYEACFPDGVRVLLEAPDYSRFLYVPYRVTRPGAMARLLRRPNHVDYADPFSVELPHSVFLAPNGV